MNTSNQKTTMSVDRQLPQYQSHKKVWALKIKQVELRPANGHIIHPEDEGYAPFAVSDEYVQKHNPQAGGYYVVYEDGYKSWSPAEAFLGGYKAIGPKGAASPAQTMEAAIVAAGANKAPRITLADIEANIVHTEIVKHISHTGQVLRWAVLTTKNGFAVVGRPSVSVSPENDRADIGEQVAIENARGELWPLMGYALKNQLAT